MAPKRRAKVVVKSTRKIVKETVQVAVVDKTEGDDNGDPQQSETVPLEDIAEEKEERVVTEIPIEEPSKDEPLKEEPKNEEKKGKENGIGKRKKRGKKRGEFDGNEGYRTYVFRVLKQVHPGMAISSKAMSVINSYMNDMFEKITSEATKLSKYTERKTLSSREIQGAVRLVLPGELGKHAVAEGSKAVTNYASYDKKRSKMG
ncbi:hypothetical protein HRI_003390100 [Hibiscus trionum]|uniref:Core Histone H2A/H2B/H3 domain-containing protein n=1 Tax=Hibiscus trionum TaxID=183268 RepID=A0A9W7IND8_HIBTR|nr:hypothetical protein HRI_003390100 [Hibiscus trionum]